MVAWILYYLVYINIQVVLHNNTNSNVCTVQKETEFHTVVLDRRGAVVVLCIVEGIIEMELRM